MAALGSGLMVAGVLMALVGVGGFVDTRKVDRRFRTGYKNNEPDNRNFRRAGKILLHGVGVCIVGGAINSFFDTSDSIASSTDFQQQNAPVPEPVQVASSDITPSASGMVKLDPADAKPSPSSSDMASSREHILNSDVTSGNDQSENSAGGTTEDKTQASQSPSFQTSFDCRRATHDDEAVICSDAGLAAMDRQLGQLYNAAMKTISDPQALKQSEADWVLTRRMCNKDVDCLRQLYGQRIGQFLGSLGSKPLIATASQTDHQ